MWRCESSRPPTAMKKGADNLWWWPEENIRKCCNSIFLNVFSFMSSFSAWLTFFSVLLTIFAEHGAYLCFILSNYFNVKNILKKESFLSAFKVEAWRLKLTECHFYLSYFARTLLSELNLILYHQCKIIWCL